MAVGGGLRRGMVVVVNLLRLPFLLLFSWVFAASVNKIKKKEERDCGGGE